MREISRRTMLSGAAAATLLPRAARAQGDYPNRPVRFIVPLAAGGGLDFIARLVVRLNVDYLMDLIPVAMLGRHPQVFGVHP